MAAADQPSGEPDQPRWDLLPHNPAEFFGLAEPFDRKELKRRYSHWIRRFKPEHHPDEFQRIRAAYEQLEASLRYGRQSTLRPGESFGQWSIAESTTPDAPREPRTPAPIKPLDPRQPTPRPHPAPHPRLTPKPEPKASPAAAPLHARLASEPPERLYKELHDRPHKTAYEYYALAVLADLVKPAEPLLFLRWLLTGLKALPREAGLFQVLYEYLHGSVPDDAIARVLKSVSKVVPGDGFYYLTESLWDRLLDRVPWQQFQLVLSNCEESVGSMQVEGKVTFYVHLLRQAIWKAPDAWLDGAFAFLNEHQRSISRDLEYELELTLQLDRYRRQRGEFLNGNPVRDLIDAAIREFCASDEFTATQDVVRRQIALAQNSRALVDAFPIGADHSETLAALSWISHETRQRMGFEPPSPGRTAAEHVMGLMEEIDKAEKSRSWELLLWARYAMDGAALFLAMFPTAIVASFFFQFPMSTLALLSLGVYFAFGLIYFFKLRERTTIRWYDHLQLRLGTRRYNADWRPATLRFLAATQYPAEFVQHAVRAILESNKGRFGASTWLPYFLSQDYGLVFYSQALAFVR